VLADGNPDSGILILGEAPSAEDLRTGRPFTGPAGHLLDRMLAAIGLDRSGCYITLLCPRRRVPGPPEEQDIARDLPLTLRHIRLAAPRHLLLLGGTPAQTLTGNPAPISKLRGQPLDLVADGHRVRAVATFNPAYLLRRPADKALAWADLLAFRRLITPPVAS
jgi:DNA polymerase